MKIKGKVPGDSPERLNIIVEGSKVIGDIITESNLRIDGEVLGNVTSAAKVVVGPNGKIKGNLTSTDADVEGYVEGALKVDSLLSLRATSNVNGEISTAKLHVDEGAQFSGNCKMNNLSSAKPMTSVKQEMKQEDVVY